MHLPRHTITSHVPAPAFVRACFSTIDQAGDASTVQGAPGWRGKAKATEDLWSDDEPEIVPKRVHRSTFACATTKGFFVVRTFSTEELARREFLERQGGLVAAIPVDDSSLLLLVGGGRVPRFAPNKVILWDDAAEPQIERKSQVPATSKHVASELVAPADPVTPSAAAHASHSSLLESTESLQSITASKVALPESRASLSDPLRHSQSSVHGLEDLFASRASVASERSTDRSSANDSDSDSDDMFMSAADLAASRAKANRSTANAAQLSDSRASKAPTQIEASTATLQGKTTSEVDVSTSTLSTHNARETLPARASGAAILEVEFGETVRGVKVKTFGHADGGRFDRLVILVSLVSKAAIFELCAPSAGAADGVWTVHQRAVVNTMDTLDGLGAIAAVKGQPDTAVVALPGRQPGHVQLFTLPVALSELQQPNGPTAIIAAHTSPLSGIALSGCGSLLATTSEKGTLVRIWSTVSTSSKASSRLPQAGAPTRTKLGIALVRELRRGLDTAKIHDICFSPDGAHIATASETGTIHFFGLISPVRDKQASRSRNSSTRGFKTLSQLAQAVPSSMMPQYFKSEWSSAQFRISLQSYSARAAGAPDSQGDAGWVRIGGKESTASGPSTEGQWAGIRERIGDVRRGEAGVDERIFLSWIRVEDAFHLVAITSSGSYYRVSLEAEKSSTASENESDDDTEQSVVLDMYKTTRKRSAARKEKAMPATQNAGAVGCKLEEYRKFGQRDDFA